MCIQAKSILTFFRYSLRETYGIAVKLFTAPRLKFDSSCNTKTASQAVMSSVCLAHCDVTGLLSVLAGSLIMAQE